MRRTVTFAILNLSVTPDRDSVLVGSYANLINQYALETNVYPGTYLDVQEFSVNFAVCGIYADRKG